jgi:hypothetical protein
VQGGGGHRGFRSDWLTSSTPQALIQPHQPTNPPTNQPSNPPTHQPITLASSTCPQPRLGSRRITDTPPRELYMIAVEAVDAMSAAANSAMVTPSYLQGQRVK